MKKVLCIIIVFCVTFMTGCSEKPKREIETLGVLEAKSNGDLNVEESWRTTETIQEMVKKFEEENHNYGITPEMAVEIANIHFKHYYDLGTIASTCYSIYENTELNIYIVCRNPREMNVLDGCYELIMDKNTGAVLSIVSFG